MNAPFDADAVARKATRKAQAAASRTDAEAAADAKAQASNEGAKTAQRERIIEAVLDAGITFWCDADGYGYATVPSNGRIARYRVRSRRFGLLVRSVYGQANMASGKGNPRPGSVSDSAMNEAIPAFEAMALFGVVRDPAVRICGHRNNSVCLDLGDDEWRGVVIKADGWRVLDAFDIPLIRPDGLRALPLPVRQPDALGNLRRLLNLQNDINDFRLVVAWLVAALWPTGPYPVLAVDGEQGSAKSTVTKMLRRLIDPNKAEHRAPPKCEDDLLIAAMNGRVVALDNVSFIEPDMADALCRLATGAGFSKRRLYSDGDEIIVSIARPVLMNGIPSLLARGDLADRAIAITLPPIPDKQRRPEADVWAEFDAAAPAILGLLLDGVATALRRLPDLNLPRLPRMADFARLACAAAPAFGWVEKDMLDAIEANRAGAVEAVIESDAVAVAVQSLVSQRGSNPWTGTATQLLESLNNVTTSDARNDRAWPKDAARLSTRIKRVQPAMRRVGIEIADYREGRDRIRKIQISGNRQGASAPSAASANAENHCGTGTFDADAEKLAASASDPQASANSAAYQPEMPVNKGFFEHADSADAADAVSPSLEGWV